MICKSDYLKLKKYLRLQSKVQIKDLISTLELNDNESKLLLSWYDGDKVIKTCMENYISEDTYTSYLKKIFSKILLYIKYFLGHLSFNVQ